MGEALAILNRHLEKAKTERRFHLDRQHKGNVEAMIAGHKVAWLQDLIREMGGPADKPR